MNVRDYHRKMKLDSPFTRAAVIYPINTNRFRPWTNSGFTLATWVKWQEGSRLATPSTADTRLHVWSVGSNKVIMSVYLDSITGQFSVEVTRPNATLTKDTAQRMRKSPSLASNGNGSGSGNGSASPAKRTSSVTNLFLKTIRVDCPEYFVTKGGGLALGRRMEAHRWQHVAWSVALFPEQMVLVMTVAGAEQFTVQVPLENALLVTKTASVSLLCVGETKTTTTTMTSAVISGGYCTTGVTLFKKSIPEVQVIAELVSYGPDCTHLGTRCQVEQIVPNRGLVNGQTDGPGSLVEMDAVQVLRETLLLTYSAQNVDLVVLDGEALGSMAFGLKLTPHRNRSFATNLVVAGGLDVLLYLFARVVELQETPTTQALALRTLLEAAHRNMSLFADFKRRHGDAISSVLRTVPCDKSLHMLKIVLDVAFDGPVLEVVDGGRSYKMAEGECRLLRYPELIISTINNFDAWVDERGEDTVIEVLFEVLIWLNVSSVRGGAYSKRQLIQANALGAILNFCKMHVGGICSRIRVTRTMAERLVELLGIYGPTPPGADYLDELAKLLLLIHEPSCVFVTQDRVNYYYLLAACPPDRKPTGLSRTAKRFAQGLPAIQRKRRVATAAAAVVERSRNPSQETLWKPRSSLWEIGGEAEGVGGGGGGVGGEVVVAGEQSGGNDRGGRTSRIRRKAANVRESVLELSTVREGDKVACQKIETRGLVKMSRTIYNKKVTRRRRTIERRTPLYNRLRAHVRKKENSEYRFHNAPISQINIKN